MNRIWMKAKHHLRDRKIAGGRAKPRFLRSRRTPGFSGEAGGGLIEIVVATLILSFVAIGMAEFFARGRIGFDREERKRVATLLAQEALERTVSRTYDQMDPWSETRTVDSVDYTISVTTQANAPELDLKTIRCDVSWNATATATRTASLETIVFAN